MRLAILFLLIVLPSSCFAGEKVNVPLNEIWAYKMQGTRDVHGLATGELSKQHAPGWGYEDYQQERQKHIDLIQKALAAKPSADDALPGFMLESPPSTYVLRTIGNQMARHVLHGGQQIEPDDSFPVDKEMTLIFFSHPLSYYIQLKEVVREGTKITVTYQPIPHFSAESTVHFALIPLGKLPVGEYRVFFKEARMDQEFFKAGFIPPTSLQRQKQICHPFFFTIWDPPQPDDGKLSKNAVVIPLDSVWGHKLFGTKDIYELEGGQEKLNGMMLEERLKHSVVSRIGRALSRYDDKRIAGKGFVLTNAGLDALQRVDEIFADPTKRTDTVSATSDLILCFYAYAGGRSVVLDQIVREGNNFTIKYHFVAANYGMHSPQFALIPLDKLPPGEYHVEVKQLPGTGPGWGPQAPPMDPNRVRQLICQSFDFAVND